MRDWIVPIGAALILLATGINARAADVPCPPKRYFCWQVKLAVDLAGEQVVRDKAKKCGWSDIKIEQAAKCLR